ncbi:hypothetical protein D3Y57_02760 (plasmid) [Sphingomonas paeninsulae]|uniref:Uncharacterized protein n=1 Tax=Sphingomonas paeninsulae TaxID=2319844 RepID=A0A494TGP3_SPHPE|nr:hypothetical protein [Sphingomonas paeninsulae]AYJ84991.1 hypothetical protein D3Y57_02760 [Sphingomonas paeninsulae]
MFKFVTIAALFAATTAVPAQARGWLPTPVAQVTQPTENAPTEPFMPSGKGLIPVSAKDSTAQRSWWTMRSQRGAERRMAACVAMPACAGDHTASATNG